MMKLNEEILIKIKKCLIIWVVFRVLKQHVIIESNVLLTILKINKIRRTLVYYFMFYYSMSIRNSFGKYRKNNQIIYENLIFVAKDIFDVK